MSTVQLARPLFDDLGIRARPSRNTALMDLAAELPAAVLSEMLGLHAKTATRSARPEPSTQQNSPWAQRRTT